MIEVIDLNQKFSLFDEHWVPHVVGSVNQSAVKLAKLKGEFPWHAHQKEDEMFLVIRGSLTIRLREQELHLQPGQFTIIPATVEHQPVCEDEVWVLLFEPKETVNTGDLKDSGFTRTQLPSI